MDKEFWISLARNEYRIPEEHTLENLAAVLFGYLGSTDPQLRDDIAYTVYASWLKRGMIPREMISAHIHTLLSNLKKGIGETESDSVFLRAFSVLLLAEIVHNDNKKPLLEAEQARAILTRGLWYLSAENDPRGYVPEKGWAHAVAHTADLMLVLARNRHIQQADLWNMLAAIMSKSVHATQAVYIHNEDERLACAVVEILKRDLLSSNQLALWSKSFSEPDGRDWKGALMDEQRNRAFQNTRNLLRSIYLELIAQPEQFPDRDQHIRLVLNALSDLKPF